VSYLLGSLLALAGLLFAVLLWQKLPTDGVGRPPRVRREQEGGIQGRAAHWLCWDAALDSPRQKDLHKPVQERAQQVGMRSLAAAVVRFQHERQVSLEEAHALLQKEVSSPATRAFLAGKMRRAIRIHWRYRYMGPSFLFIPWFYLVAKIRYGYRHLYLETLAAVLQELRRT
jgi:hypothetical protein